MKVLIMEDEALAARRLVRQLQAIRPDFEVLATLPSVREGLEWLQSNPAPDLMFFDIHLADGSSFDILEQHPVRIPIIFTTAYDQYALQAFKAYSVDYLLKPVKDQELAAAIEKWESFGQAEEAEDDSALPPMDQLGRMIRGEETPYQKRFLVRLPERLKAIDIKEVAYFYIQQRITLMRLHNGSSYPADFNLDQLEEKLHPKEFFRANRQVIVRFEAIAQMYTHSKSRLKLELKPALDQEVVVPSERSAAFKRWLTGS